MVRIFYRCLRTFHLWRGCLYTGAGWSGVVCRCGRGVGQGGRRLPVSCLLRTLFHCDNRLPKPPDAIASIREFCHAEVPLSECTLQGCCYRFLGCLYSYRPFYQALYKLTKGRREMSLNCYRLITEYLLAHALQVNCQGRSQAWKYR